MQLKWWHTLFAPFVCVAFLALCIVAVCALPFLLVGYMYSQTLDFIKKWNYNRKVFQLKKNKDEKKQQH